MNFKSANRQSFGRHDRAIKRLLSHLRRLRDSASKLTANPVVADEFFKNYVEEALVDLVEKTKWPAEKVMRRSQWYFPSHAA